jgi:phage-related tail protein
MAGLGVVEERVMEGMRASQLRDVSEMEEMVGISDQMGAMGEQMSVMSKQLGLLPSQLRLLGRQCDEVKGQLGRLADEQAVMGRRVEEVQRGVKEQLEEIGQGQRDMLRQLEEVADEQHELRRQQGVQLCDEVREVTEHAVQRSVHEEVNGKLSEIRKEMEQMKGLCGTLDGIAAVVVGAGQEISEAREEFDRVGACTECIWEFLTKEVGKGFEPAVRRSFGVLGDVLVEAVEEMRQMSDDMSVRQGRFEEVARESVRQEVRVQECMGTAVSEEMSKSDERLRGVLRDLKGQLGVLQKEMRVGMMRVQQRGGRGEEVMSENGSSAAATELAEGRRAREKGAGLWEGAVYEGQQGEGVQLFAGPPMQWVGGGRE